MSTQDKTVAPLLRKVLMDNAQSPYTECWIWRKSRSGVGYGDFRLNGEHWQAHRAAYFAFVGPIPDGMHVLHRCDVRLCCNPDHLFLGTNSDNILDSMLKGRRKGITRKRPAGIICKKSVRKCVRCSGEFMGNAKAMFCRPYCKTAWYRRLKKEKALSSQ